jgi:hypothetical protein
MPGWAWLATWRTASLRMMRALLSCGMAAGRSGAACGRAGNGRTACGRMGCGRAAGAGEALGMDFWGRLVPGLGALVIGILSFSSLAANWQIDAHNVIKCYQMACN